MTANALNFSRDFGQEWLFLRTIHPAASGQDVRGQWGRIPLSSSFVRRG